ncbi:MAG: acyltransferase [Ruminococcaceae bacterium]|nr:acyltransferase [Oscillospiraceae bacterium]
MIFTRLMKRIRAKYLFSRNAIIGQNVVVFSSARCLNRTKEKNRIVIGSNANIYGTLLVDVNGMIHIGEHFYLGEKSVIGAAESIVIGDCVIISNDVVIYDNNNHPTEPKARERMSRNGFDNDNWSWKWAKRDPIIIEDNVWIGQYSSILKGITIGKGSIVAKCSVVTKDVPPYSVVAGNPARVVKFLNPDDDISMMAEINHEC